MNTSLAVLELGDEARLLGDHLQLGVHVRLPHPVLGNHLEPARVPEHRVFDAQRVHLPRTVLLRLRPDCEPEERRKEGGGFNFLSNSKSVR